MKRLLCLCAVLALTPSVAVAKEVRSAKVCGPDGCNVSQDHAAIAPLVEGGPPTGDDPPYGGPAYRVIATVQGEGAEPAHDTFATLMVPSLRLIRNADGIWMTMPAATLAALRAVAGDLRPFPPTAVGLKAPPARHAPTSAPAGGTDDGVAWWIPAAAAVLAAALAAALLVRRRGPAVS